MSEATYKVVEIIGSSPESWEQAAKNAINEVSKRIKDVRVAEIVKMDMKVGEGGVAAFRIRINVSFKYDEASAA